MMDNRILVVDDDPPHGACLIAGLLQKSYEVVTTASGEEARPWRPVAIRPSSCWTSCCPESTAWKPAAA